MRELAPAKINLALDILGRRPDGYHELRMVMQAVSLYDTVTVEEGGSCFALLADGIAKERIRKFGIAFDGKTALVVGGE